jgi:uncharacterized protein
MMPHQGRKIGMPGTLDKVETREPLMIAHGDQTIFGILHRPAGFENPPVVVVLHGFASSKHGSNRCYVTLAEYLAKFGIATIRFDFRGSGDSDGNLSEISLEDLIADATVVLESVEKIEGIDASRIGLFGASLGGAIAVIAAARFQKIKALALWAPVASGELWYHDFLKRHPEHLHTDPFKVLSSYRGVKLNEAFCAEFKQMFAYQMMQKLSDVPLLCMQGEKDETVSILHLEAFRHACSGFASPTRFVKYPNGEHSLGFSPLFETVLEESKWWFENYL